MSFRPTRLHKNCALAMPHARGEGYGGVLAPLVVPLIRTHLYSYSRGTLFYLWLCFCSIL